MKWLLLLCLLTGCCQVPTEVPRTARHDWRLAQHDPVAKALFNRFLAAWLLWLADDYGANGYDAKKSLACMDAMLEAERTLASYLEGHHL